MNDLTQVYLKHAASKRIFAEVLTKDNGHTAIKLTGPSVQDAFKNEPGKHVVQRVPPTERSGRWQTSVVTVSVLALPPERSLIPLREQDLEVICQTGKQKAGGQNVNKVASAVRMKHLPTGISVFVNGRDQVQNRKKALCILTAKVNQKLTEERESAYCAERKQQMLSGSDKLGGRGDKVRTWNFIRNRIVDHRLGKKTSNVKEVMKGNLSILFEGEASSDEE